MSSRPPTRHEGSCHCGAIRFAITSDFPELTTCNCSMCKRRGALMVKVPVSEFELMAGADQLAEYRFHTETARHFFCRTCGIYPFHRKRLAPDHFGVNIACLHEFDHAGIPVRETNGVELD